jgi:hypothetical protein
LKKPLGELLVEKKLITEEQLTQALERQRLCGGRLGSNLSALGFLKREKLASVFNPAPQVPQTVEDTGLDFSFIADLVMKHVLFMGEFGLNDIAERVKLPQNILDPVLESLRGEQFLRVRGAQLYSRQSFRFIITEQGINRANSLLDVCRYVGPAPVTLEDYRAMVDFQTVKNVMVRQEEIVKAFSGLVVGEPLLRRLGPALSSGKEIFLYGPPGNGKTTIAETIGSLFSDTIFMPYALLVRGEIINVYDPVSHVTATPPDQAETPDLRWLAVHRPVVMAGGELTLRTLDLDFNTITKFYEAPLQMKANNGLLIIDDFGRQQVDPQLLLNRWMVPLDRRIDFLTLHTGMKFSIPFDTLIVFSTNLEPAQLADEAFLRRIRYKIRIDYPTEDAFERIFRLVCEQNGIGFCEEAYEDLMENYYRRLGVRFNACHPRDLIELILEEASYHGHPPELTPEALAFAWENYFVKI